MAIAKSFLFIKRDATYSNPFKKITSYTKYSYNGNGDVVRTESYVDGEEYKTGKNIQETFYDKQGRAVKTVTYNTLETAFVLMCELGCN